jgi:hypothetical protein
MGKFADFYVVPPQEVERAAQSQGRSKSWPHYTIKRVDVFQVADLFDILRGGPRADSWQEFRQEISMLPTESEDEVEAAEGADLISQFPASMVGLLARLDEKQYRDVAAVWQASPDFFRQSQAGAADEILAALCALAKQAVALGQTIILVESGV